MLDLPHVAIESQFRPLYSLVEERLFDPMLAWVHPLAKSTELSALASAESQIDELSALREGWDGFGGLPVNETTRYNSLDSLRGLLQSAPVPEITPTSNGTVCLEWNSVRGVAHLEIGQRRISFYIKPQVGKPIFRDASVSDILLESIIMGILISANLYPLQHGTTSVTTIRMDADVSCTF